MSRSKQNIGKKQWIKTDQQLLLLKESSISTSARKDSPKQIYKLRVAKWGKYQAVVEKRLYVFSDQDMDYRPGRLMGLNMQDLQIIYQNYDKISKIMLQVFNNIQKNDQYKQRILAHKNKENLQ